MFTKKPIFKTSKLCTPKHFCKHFQKRLFQIWKTVDGFEITYLI